MEVNTQEDLQQQNPSITYQTVQDRDHTLVCVRADVYELSPATSGTPAKWDLKCNSEPLSLCYDSFRFMYRALCLKGTEIIVNSCIMPDSQIVKTAPLFCTWNDERTKKHIGFGFKQEVVIDTFIKAFEEAKKNMGELLSQITPISTKQYQNHPQPWQQPIMVSYNVAVEPQPPNPQDNSRSVFTSPAEGNRTSSRTKPNDTNFMSKLTINGRKGADNNSRENNKRTSVHGSYEKNRGLSSEYERKPLPQQLSVDPEVFKISTENIQLRQFLVTNHAKINELKNESESLKHRNDIIQKSNEVLANNTNGLQMKCEELERKRQHWQDLAEKSEQDQIDKLEESKTKRKNQLADILEQRDNIKTRSQQQQLELSRLRSQEESLTMALEELNTQNKAVTVAERKIQNDSLLIKKMATDQLRESKEVENKVEQTLQSLIETGVDIKKSVKRTSNIIDNSDKK